MTAVVILGPGGYAFKNIRDLMDARHEEVLNELGEIHGELKEMNGRQRQNTNRLAKVEQRLDSSGIA